MSLSQKGLYCCNYLKKILDHQNPQVTVYHIFILFFSFIYIYNYVYSESDKQIQGIISDRVPEELWMQVRDIVQEAGIKTIPKKKKWKKAKWLFEEGFQIAEKRKEAKGKGEKERYIHLNAEFQRTARRDNKAFLSDQCKEIEENNRMGETGDHFKKLEIPTEYSMQR